MIEEISIEEFCDFRTGKTMRKSCGYVNNDKAVLFEKTGHIIIFDKKYVYELMEHRIPKELEGKLTSRMFIKDESNNVNYKCGNKAMPEFIMVDLTKKCNMHCRYCLRDVSGSDKSISSETLNDICRYIADYCNRHKLKDITIQPWGGEPLIELESILMMRKKLADMETHVHFSIETNALLLDECTIEKLYDNKIGIGISIDGYQEVHDLQRVYENGVGTHSVVEKNLKLAKNKYGKRLGTITTITTKNAAYIEEILEYYATDLGLENVKFNYVHESMYIECSDLCLPKQEIANTEIRLLNKIVELNERGYNISEHNINVKLKNILLKRYTDICHSCGCMGGRKMIVFDMNGNIYPCELTDAPKEKFGSIYDSNDLLDSMEVWLKNNDFFTEKKDDVCSDCMWYVFCKGGCTVRVINEGKRPPEIDETECAVNTSLYPELLKLVLENPRIVNKMLGFSACE
jgi:uncharacterized protein